MKKTIALILVCVMIMFALAACGGPADGGNSGSSSSSVLDIDSVKTLSDVLSFETEEHQSAFTEETYAYVFESGGQYYRVKADLPADVSKELWDLDMFDDDYDARITEILGPIEITSIENLSDMIPSRDELDRFVGKTGQDLLDDGWTNWGYNLDTMEFWMEKGPFSYIVVFDGGGQKYENTDDFDAEAAIASLEILSVEYDGLGDAAEI